MSIVCHPRLPDTYTITPSTRSFTLTWNIHSTAPLNPFTVEAAAETPSVGDSCPYLPSLFAQSVTFEPNKDAYHWTARVEYGPRTIEGEYKQDRPWNNPPDIRNSVEFEQVTQDYEYVDPYEKEEIGEDGEPYTVIKNTQPLLNVICELYNPAPTRRVAIEIKQIRWWIRSWRDEWSEQFRDSLNYTPIVLDGLSYSALTLWCTQLLYNRHYYGNGQQWCYQIDAEFRYRKGGWRYKPIQASFNAKNPTTGKIEQIYEKDGQLYYAGELTDLSRYSPISEPALLDENGALLVRNRADVKNNLDKIRYGNHRLLGAMDWKGLSIPTMKGIRT